MSLKEIHDPSLKRDLRTNNREVDPLLLYERQELVHRRSRHRNNLGARRDTGVTRRAHHVRNVLRYREAPAYGVLSRAASNYKNFHRRSLLVPKVSVAREKERDILRARGRFDLLCVSFR
jgi:hypothetical protein